MHNTSVFIFSCLCGRQFQKEGKEAFHCPDCGRLLLVEWGVDAEGETAVTTSDVTSMPMRQIVKGLAAAGFGGTSGCS